MFDLTTLLVCALLGVGAGATIFAGYTSVKDWVDEKNKLLRDWKDYALRAEAEAQRLNEENDSLRADVRSALCRELAWLSERKMLNSRVALAFKEMAMDDPNKKTTVFRPE